MTILELSLWLIALVIVVVALGLWLIIYEDREDAYEPIENETPNTSTFGEE